MYLPPVLRPLAAVGPFTPAVQRIAEVPCSLVRGVPGSYVAERLAGLIQSWERLGDCVWLRANDAGPSSLAHSLAVACQHRWGSGESSAFRSASGPRLSAEINEAPEGAIVVVELGGWPAPRVTHMIRAVRPAVVGRGVRLVVVTECRVPVPSGGWPDWVAPASDLLDRGALDGFVHSRGRVRLHRYARKRIALVEDVLAAAELWSEDAVVEALDASHSARSFLGRLTSLLLDGLTLDQRSALEVASNIGYWHPQMGTAPVTADELRPWLVPLEQQWGWVRPIWIPSLRRELARSGGHTQQQLDGRASARGGTRAVVPAVPSRTATSVDGSGLLEARLLGPLEVRVDGSHVHSWSGQRSVSVLRYLLSRPMHSCSRDELLDEFWPDAPVDAARNRLQVAVSGLRRSFRDVTALNVVEYADGGYRINRALRVDVDAEAFERGVRAGGAAERGGDREEARRAYREAVALYRGDFAADAPFEQWTLLPRESLRIALIDTLDRLARIDLAERRIDDCIATAIRILDIDPCREDAHRLLMRCYAGQGRVYQALRQYDFCTRMLRAMVDAGPARETTQLYDAIRRRSSSDLATID